MKIKVKDKEEFKPFDVIITFESEKEIEDVLNLLRQSNLKGEIIKQLCFELENKRLI